MHCDGTAYQVTGQHCHSFQTVVMFDATDFHSDLIQSKTKSGTADFNLFSDYGEFNVLRKGNFIQISSIHPSIFETCLLLHQGCRGLL